MKIPSSPVPRLALALALALPTITALADTVLTFEGLPTGQFHNTTIIQSFGDNASVSGPGLTVTGIGTPDIDLTWSALSATNQAATRWDYYYYAGPPQPEPWSAGQLNQSWIGDYHDLKFTPGNDARVVIKSFNFHGYYGIVPSGGTNFQERFTYDWQVLDAGSQASLANGNYSFLSDSNKNHNVAINYTGANGQPLILRLTRVASNLGTGQDPVEVEGLGADIAVDDIMFSEEIGAANLSLASVSLQDGLTNVGPNFSYLAKLSDGFQTQVVPGSVQLLLNGLPLTPDISKAGLITSVRFEAGGLLRNGSTNTYRLIYTESGAPTVTHTNDTTFVVRYNNYEWRFTQGDLSAALGNGVMDYADGDSASLSSFGTTDGSTVPHIAGSPAKYLHVPAFASDISGYWLTLNDTGPNVGTNGYVNRYTLLFDMLVPAPMDYLPFFNSDPYNLNDADFYLYNDGAIGIGGGGYSAPGTIALDTWYRIAFVADLVANTLTYYVNGTMVKSRAADGLEGRWSLYSNEDVGPDLLLFNEGDTSGVYTHEAYVSSVSFMDRAIGADEAAGLGEPKATGILSPSFNPAPALAIQANNGGVTLSWPTNVVGYAVEQSATLANPTWLPVWGITNNSVTLTPSAVNRFYRLVQ